MRSSLALVLVLCVGSVATAQNAVGRDAKSHLPAFSARSLHSERPSRPVWTAVETSNFTVRSTAETKEAAAMCERLREELRTTWLPSPVEDCWYPRCEVVLHPSVESYMSYVGRSGRNSSGCSTIKVESGNIISRRIDIRFDQQDLMASALPHELTHMVLADHFSGGEVPRWADEGIAVLSDPDGKRMDRLEDVQDAINRRNAFAITDLVTLQKYPVQHHLGVFYGQSASLVDFLVGRGTTVEFVEFLKQAERSGYDRALQQCYDIRNLGELERLWLVEARQQNSLRTVLSDRLPQSRQRITVAYGAK